MMVMVVAHILQSVSAVDVEANSNITALLEYHMCHDDVHIQQGTLCKLYICAHTH